MADIDSKVNQIRQAVLGKDVRETIASGIEAINEEVESTTEKQEILEAEFDQLVINAGSSNAEIVQARVDASGKSYASLQERMNNNDSALADIAYSVNADRTGVISASAIINAAISGLSDGDELHFFEGVYAIDSPIIWDRKVKLIGHGRVTLKATANIETLVKASGFTTYTDVQIPNFYLDGNNKANYCLMIDGSPLYATRLVIKDCECRHALFDGIHIVPPAWSIQISNTLSNGHGRDGIRAIMLDNPGLKQINHVICDNCTFNDNLGDGVNILGVAITINNCDIENNNIGVKLDATQCVDPYASFHINIIKSYIEGNKVNQIYAKTLTGDGIVLNVEGNYLNPANLGGAIIKCEGIAEGITLNFGENRIESSVANIIIDGGNALSSASLIKSDVYLNTDRFINLGYARVIPDMFSIIMLPASTSTAPSANVHTTEDLTIKPGKKAEYPVTVDMQWKVLKLISAKIVTNASNYDITCSVKVIDKLGNVVRSVGYSIIGTVNQDWETYITNDWGAYRIPPEHFVVVSFTVNTHTADRYITINNVCLSYI